MPEPDDFDAFLKYSAKKSDSKGSEPRRHHQRNSADMPKSRAREGGSAKAINNDPSASQASATSQRQAPQRPAPQRSAPQRSASQRSASQRPVPQRRPNRVRIPANHSQQANSSSLRTNSAAANMSPSVAANENHPPRQVKRRNKRGILKFALVFIVIALIAWPLGLGIWADSKINHVQALSQTAKTPGTTYLIAGADLADEGAARADTLMLIHKAPNGNTYLTSIPRDTLVDIPGYGGYKINAAYSFGGATLLVETVENLTGLHIDHFILLGFDSVINLVDAVGDVNLCIDQDVNDERSGLVMAKGCHDLNGEQALAFVRARYFDPTADIGRQGRQQQFISSLMKKATSPAVILNPLAQLKLAHAGGSSLTTDPSTGLIDIIQAGLAMRSATANERVMQIPIADPNFQTQHSGVALLLDEAQTKEFFSQMRDGTLTK